MVDGEPTEGSLAARWQAGVSRRVRQSRSAAGATNGNFFRNHSLWARPSSLPSRAEDCQSAAAPTPGRPAARVVPGVQEVWKFWYVEQPLITTPLPPRATQPRARPNGTYGRDRDAHSRKTNSCSRQVSSSHRPRPTGRLWPPGRPLVRWLQHHLRGQPLVWTSERHPGCSRPGGSYCRSDRHDVHWNEALVTMSFAGMSFLTMTSLPLSVSRLTALPGAGYARSALTLSTRSLAELAVSQIEIWSRGLG